MSPEAIENIFNRKFWPKLLAYASTEDRESFEEICGKPASNHVILCDETIPSALLPSVQQHLGSVYSAKYVSDEVRTKESFMRAATEKNVSLILTMNKQESNKGMIAAALAEEKRDIKTPLLVVLPNDLDTARQCLTKWENDVTSFMNKEMGKSILLLTEETPRYVLRSYNL